MAKKRPAPPEQPPTPSSEEESSSEEEEETLTEQPSSKKPNPSSKPQSDEQDSEEEAESEKGSGSDSDSGSESDDDVPVKHMLAPRSVDTTVKPISSKPMTDSSKPKKPTSTSTSTSTNTNTTVFALVAKKDKSEKDTRKDRKKKKVSELEEEKKKGDVDKKNVFAKLWSENDEIVILNGLIEFKKKGKNAGTDLSGFLDFIKERLDADANRDQLKSKLQRLKQKYQSTNAGKANGGFSKPHEVKLFELSKQIWGEKSGGVEANNGAGDSVLEDEKKRKRQKNANGVASPKKIVSVSKADIPMVEVKAEDNGNRSGYRYLNASTLQYHLIKPPQELGEVFSKNGWDLVGNANAKELDRRWKSVMIAETKAYIQRLDLVRDQTKLMLEALESSNL